MWRLRVKILSMVWVKGVFETVWDLNFNKLACITKYSQNWNVVQGLELNNRNILYYMLFLYI